MSDRGVSAERRPIRILANARDLIDALSVHESLTPAEIAELTGIPRPSVYRLAEGLAAVGMTTTAADSRISLNLRWLHLADNAFAGMLEWGAADQVLRGVTASTEQTAFLTVPRGDEAVCIAWSPGSGIGVLILKPGRALPLYVGAAGRVMLSATTDLDRYLAAAPFPTLTPFTIVDADALRADADLTRSQGYVHSDQDATIGIGALGVPVLDSVGGLQGCVSLAGTAEEIRARLPELVQVLRETAAILTVGIEGD